MGDDDAGATSLRAHRRPLTEHRAGIDVTFLGSRGEHVGHVLPAVDTDRGVETIGQGERRGTSAAPDVQNASRLPQDSEDSRSGRRGSGHGRRDEPRHVVLEGFPSTRLRMSAGMPRPD